jgi:thiosulfate reductase cytochrome b subunit
MISPKAGGGAPARAPAQPAGARASTRGPSPRGLGFRRAAALPNRHGPMRARRPQPLAIRVARWLNVPLLLAMAGSGLQTPAAYPHQGPRGEPYPWFPLQGAIAPEWMRLGGWLAGARHLHLALMWPLTANALFYLAYLAVSGEWRRRAFLPRRDARSALRAAASYARLRAVPAGAELYNGLQRLAYTAALLLAALAVVTGAALYKPLQLRPLASLFGGYDGARLAHFLAMALLLLFLAGHVAMALLHPRALAEMVTGGPRRG